MVANIMKKNILYRYVENTSVKGVKISAENRDGGFYNEEYFCVISKICSCCHKLAEVDVILIVCYDVYGFH